MGAEVEQNGFSREDRQRYRQKVRRSLDVFSLMLSDFVFEADKPLTGIEIELNLVDEALDPAMCNAEILARIDDPQWQPELGQFNLEMNVPPRLIADDGFERYEEQIRASLTAATEQAQGAGTEIVMVGALPTIEPKHVGVEVLSENPRYGLLNQQIVAARGEDLHLDIRGVEQLEFHAESIGPEAASTSFQIHLQVDPESFAGYWNASQAIAGAQMALGGNSPYLFGKHLWSETRIALFEQATDTRPPELKAQGVRPRVWFGERWITSIFDLFEENVRYFPALLPIISDEDPAEVVKAGGAPEFAELRLHNGTIYRWNRPVYDVFEGRPHLRVENRVLPAGPTVVDMLANMAFYLGLVRTLVEEDRPIWTQMTFTAAEENFHAGARRGLGCSLYWPRLGEVPAAELIEDLLLPRAYAGLDSWGVAPAIRDRLLGIIEGRCRTGMTGSAWQTATVRGLQRSGLDRNAALHEMLRRYITHMHTNAPVHTWPLDRP